MRKKRYLKRILPVFLMFTMMFSYIPVGAVENEVVERENLALGKSATASGHEGGTNFTADKVTDGTIDRPEDINKGGSSRWASAVNAIDPWITIDLGEVKAFDEVVIEWERRNVNSYKVEVSEDNSTWTVVHSSTAKNEFRETLNVGSQNARYVKITIDDYSPTQEGSSISWGTVAIYEVEIYNNDGGEVTPPDYVVPEEGVNISLGKTATSSSVEAGTQFTASKAIDGVIDRKPEGRATSRWASAVSSEDQWLNIDLGERTQFNNIIIEWERKNATAYRVQISDDNETWTDVYTATAAPTTTRNIITLSEKVVGRYVRVYIDTHLANSDGVNWNNVSIFEVELYNGGISEPPKTPHEVANSLTVPALGDSDTTLTMPTVPQGFEISFVGADYEEVIGHDMTIYRPLVDTIVRVNFEVKQGDKTAFTPDIEVIVPGANEVTGNAKPTVIPELREWLGGTGNFEINDGSRIVIATSSEAALIDSMKVFAEDYKDVVGKEIEVVVSDSPKAGDFYFELNNKRPELRTEGYYMEIGEFVTVEANELQGAFLSTRTILQILKQNGTTIPQGITRDYPLSDIRGFMLDVGRKPTSLDFVYETMKLMSWYKMNDFQIHLNDNYIWVNEYGADAIEKAYAGFRLESNDVGENGVPLTSTDVFYTKAEFGKFIDDSRLYGVNIVPEIESPAHALSFMKAHPEFAYGDGVGEHAAMLDVNNPEVIEYIKGIWSEYTDGENPVFRDAVVHVGADEFYGTSEEYRAYSDMILKYIRDEKGRTPRIWGSLTQKKGNTPVTSEGVEMNIWNNGWSDPSDMFKEGYDLINTEDGKLYIVPDAGYYYNYLNVQNLYNNYEVSKFGNGDIIPAGSPQMKGGMFAVWNDMIDRKANGIVELDIFDRVLPAVQVLSEKMWGRAKDKTYAEFQEVAAKVSEAPNTNPRFKVESETENVLEYDFKATSNGIVPDKSGNGYNSVALNNATVNNGILKLNDENSYLESSIENIGPNYTVSFTVKRDENSDNNEQILFESEKGAFKAVQKETGKVGFSREFYDYSFDYELPKGEWVDITIVGRMTKTQLYVNGEYIDEVSKTSAAGDNGTFVFPLERLGSETNSFNGEVKALKVENIATSIADPTVIPQETMTATATSEHPNVGSEGLASFAIDGNPGTIWHTNYNTPVQLPQSITLDLGKAYTIDKFSYLPRNGGGNGTITQYELQVSTNGTDFTKISEGTWENNGAIKIVKFEQVENVTHVRLIAKAGVGGFASAAELNVHKVREEIVNPDPDVDKTALKAAIDYANEIVAEGGLEGVVPAVVAEFNAALAEATTVYTSEAATEEEVDAVFKRLVNAIWMLDFEQGNKDALKALVDTAKALVEKEYTADSWAKLQDVIKVAEAVIADENAMQEEVDETLDALKAAIDALVKKNVDKSALQNFVNKVDGLDKDEYIDSTWNKFEKALNAAKAVLANEDATQEEVDAAYNALVRAYLELRLVPDKSKLEDLINKINDTDLSKYTKDSVAKLNKELKSANKVLRDKYATQEQINAATRNLEVAFASLEEKKDDNNSGNNNNGKPDSGKSESDKDNNGKLPNTGAVASSFAIVLAGALLVAGGSKILKGKKED